MTEQGMVVVNCRFSVSGELNQVPLQEQYAALTAEPSL